MAMLKFKKGPWAKLPPASVEGTIYVTTDEKAMYVDISDEERIRIGDIIRVNTFNELQPPFSNTAFYYVESSNALLKRVATGANDDGETIYAWKQINGTKELQDALTALTGRVSTLEGKVGSTKSGLVKDVADLKITVGDTDSGLVKSVADNAFDIANLKKAISTDADGDTGGIGTIVAQLVKDLDQAEVDIDALENTVAGHTSTLAEHSAAITANAKAISDHATQAADTYATKTALEVEATARANAISSEVTARNEAIAVETSRATSAESALSGRIQALENGDLQSGTQVGDSINSAIIAAKIVSDKYTDDAVTNLKTEVGNTYATKTELAATNAVVSGHTSSISTINSTLATKADKSELDVFAKTADIQGTLNKVDTEGGVKATIEAAVAGEAALREAADTTHTNAISKLQGDLAGVKATADAAVTDAKLANAIKDFATTSYVDQAEAAAITAAKVAGDKDYAAKSIEDTVAGHTSALNILNGASGTAGSVAEAKAAADAAQADIDAWKTVHANDYTNSKINELVADAKKAGTDAAASANANAGEIAVLKGAIGSPKQGAGNGTEGNAAASGLYKLIEDGDKAIKTELERTIAKEINDVNAMDYKGGVGSETALNNILTPKAGDTYVVTSQFLTYYPGDLLIATGDEDEATGTIPTKNLSWLYVKTGYDASLEQKLEVVNNKVQLSSITNANNGQISFVSDGSAVTVSVTPVSDTDKNPVVTIGMVWEDFGE